MSAFTKISGKGQVVVPKSMRDLNGWPAGTDLEVVDAGDGVLLRPRRPAVDRLSVEEAVARLQQIYIHKGPPVSLDEMTAAVEQEAVARYERSR